MGVVNSRREPFASHQLLAIRYRSLVTTAEIDGDVVQAIRVNYYKVFVAGLGSHADGIDVSELYAKTQRLEGHLLKVNPVPTLAVVQPM